MGKKKDNVIDHAVSDYQKVIEFIEKVVGFLTLFSGIIYFLGWTKDSAYYLHFGLTLDLINKPTIDLISSAWLEIVIGLILLLMGYYTKILVSKLVGKTKSSNVILGLFYFLLLVSLVGGVFYGLLTTIYRSFDIVERIRDIGLMLLFVYIFWIATTIGEVLNNVSKSNSKSKRFTFFRILYPNSYLFLIISILGLAFVLSRLSSARGLYYGLRDTQHPAENLPEVILVDKNQLPVSGIFDKGHEMFVYKNLYFIYSNSEYIFVYGNAPDFDATKQFRTYAIPKTDNNQLILKK